MNEYSDLFDHIDLWVDYLVKLIDLKPEDKGHAIKYQRQLEAVLSFRQATGSSPRHNFIMADLYSDQIGQYLQQDIKDAQNSLRTLKIDPIQDCYTQTNSAFKEIKKAISAKSIFFLQGPPGTGKTTSITEIVLQALEKNPNIRILIASETHAAVDNALNKITGLLPNDLHQQVLRHPVYKFGNESLPGTETFERANQCWEQLEKFDPELSEELWLTWNQGSTTDLPKWIKHALAEKHRIIGVTCNQLYSLVNSDSEDWDLSIIDECSKATFPELLMPLTRSRKVIFVGDHHQLPPTFCKDESDTLEQFEEEKANLIKGGVIDQMFKNAPAELSGFLDTQYRMTPSIGTIVSETFYGGRLKNGRENTGQKDPIVWLDYQTHRKFPEVEPRNGGKLENSVEVELILSELETIASQPSKNTSIAIITPYLAQKRLLIKAIGAKFSKQLEIEIDTVDAFQGRQANIVFFSFVRNSGSMRFFSDHRRLNVAISRAEDQLFFVGMSSYLAKSETPVIQKILNSKILVKTRPQPFVYELIR